MNRTFIKALMALSVTCIFLLIVTVIKEYESFGTMDKTYYLVLMSLNVYSAIHLWDELSKGHVKGCSDDNDN
ncbi:hypothetical protein [Metabacillus fastidiosus]|uniref:TMhelix containing protein n=1 Tax=Metabacillus fastidiosus TaxID=1458 RepID=A0ABU6NSV6_9BACI|nr:hypothetical protein [Metabacillus fastidiosus]